MKVSDSEDGVHTELHEVSELLSCEVSWLKAALQSRTVEARGETVMAELSALEATRTRDALCRALYNRLFTWVVARLNEAIKVKTMGRRKVLGILDIFGFEILETNSFEQLIINFCNEKLHQVLTEVTLKQTQEDYLREGIDWTPIDIPTNNAVVDLIEQRQTGVLAVIEEVSSRVGGGTDALMQQLSFSCGGHLSLTSKVPATLTQTIISPPTPSEFGTMLALSLIASTGLLRRTVMPCTGT
nr:unconventional myosin-Ia-like [Cherax quadricarinatus]